MAIVCIAGLCGNIAAIFDFCQPRRTQKNFYILMLHLAIFDVMYITLSIFLFILPQISDAYKHNGPWHYLIPWGIPIGQILLTGSVYFTVAITVERYLTVCKPFYMFSRDWNVWPIVIGIIVFAIAYNMPKFFEFTTKYQLCFLNQTLLEDTCTLIYSAESCVVKMQNDMQHNESNFSACLNSENMNYSDQITHTIFESRSIDMFTVPATEMRLNSLYVQIYAVNLSFLLNTVIPFAVVIILNILILKELLNIQRTVCEPRIQAGNNINNPIIVDILIVIILLILIVIIEYC